MSIPASFQSVTSFLATGDRTAEFVPGVRVKADCGPDGFRLATVVGAVFADPATAVSLSGQPLTANLTGVWHGNDTPESLCDHAANHASGGRDALTPAAIGAAAAGHLHAGVYEPADAALQGHLASAANPHAVTAAQVGAVALARTISTTAPLSGGGDLTADRTLAVAAATASAPGVVELATSAETQAGTDATRAVTPAGLLASVKGLISANMTIHVRTDGSDANDGTANDPAHAKASIAGALASIAGKLIASGATVTVQVADGVYTLPARVDINHPDGEKIFLHGNTSAETTVAITAIDTGAKTIAVSGDYTASIQVGDIVTVLGSSTPGLNGAYRVSGRTYSGGVTTVTCAAETIASSTVGGGSLVIKPCNRCVLTLANNQTGFFVTSALGRIRGFRVNSPTTSAIYAAIWGYGCQSLDVSYRNIIDGCGCGIRATSGARVYLGGVVLKGQSTYGVTSEKNAIIDMTTWEGTNVVDGAPYGVFADTCGNITSYGPLLTLRNNSGAAYSPAVNTLSAKGAFIAQ